MSDMLTGMTTPVLGFAAFSGTGKTTLLRGLIPILRQRGLRLGLLKHSHHAFEVDLPGKDSYLLKQAGASQVVVASKRRTAVMLQTLAPQAPGLRDFLGRLDNAGLDLLLVEGYKFTPLTKIELHRPSLGHPLLARDDPNVIAVASDAPLDITQPLLDINDPVSIADFIIRRFHHPIHPVA